jgi:hypothetical protein
MSETPDYLNPHRIYPAALVSTWGTPHDEVVVSKTENTTDPLPFEPDEDDYRPEIYPPKKVPGLIEEEEG